MSPFVLENPRHISENFPGTANNRRCGDIWNGLIQLPFEEAPVVFLLTHTVRGQDQLS